MSRKGEREGGISRKGVSDVVRERGKVGEKEGGKEEGREGQAKGREGGSNGGRGPTCPVRTSTMTLK